LKEQGTGSTLPFNMKFGLTSCIEAHFVSGVRVNKYVQSYLAGGCSKRAAKFS